MAGKTYFDYPTLFLVIFLICFGLVMIYSTSSYKSTVTYGNSYHWLLRQAVAIVLGAVAMVVCCKLDYHIMKSETVSSCVDHRCSKEGCSPLDQHRRISVSAIRSI